MALALVVAACASDGKKVDGPPPLPVELEGNDGVSTRRLKFAARREMASFEENGRRLADLADAAYSMDLELRRRGYAHSEVSFRLEPSDEAPEKVVFVVEEGPLVRIGKVSFPGKTPKVEEELMKFFPTGANPPFLQSQVDNAVGEIERAYLLKGYRDVRAGPAQVTWKDDNARADIIVPIDEGEQYTIADYTLEGDLDPDLVRKYLTPLVDEGFYLRLPSEAAALIRADLFNRGHQKAKVSVDTKFDGTKATLHFRVEMGPVYHVRNIEIEGRDRTRERFVSSRIRLEKGDVVSQSEIEKSIDGLYRTGVFRKVEANKSFPTDVEMDIEFLVEEIKARSVAFELGWGSYELARGSVRYQDRNFLGFGRLLDIDATASTKGYSIHGVITDNYVFGEKNLLRFAAGLFQREEPSFTRLGYGVNISVTHRYNSPWTVTMGYSLDSQEASDIKSVIPDETEGELITSAGLFTSVVYDNLDSSLLPKKGVIMEAGIRWSSPVFGADLDFVELRLSYFQFWNLGERLVLGAGARFESNPILDGSRTLPIQKRLFLGGATSIRSFDQSELGPFDPITREPLGGLTALSLYTELRVRLWRDLHGATFYEVGMVSPHALSIDGPPGHSIGAGLRYYLPVGPIRIDYAYNPGELFAASQRWQIHLAFGFSF